ncbi:MAG: bifunctional (p)ppGpp synthetase/guanosine-3',5'-bis(diphosphate) 3'-pyrophosphohydrolase [Bacilli bacterium]|nr:bifunctional (p)ppGpp synthetase/guanosine-3',5'-bis(diphosphate) 3'-pyrophosphohydrolase [Bacilli bacterium]
MNLVEQAEIFAYKAHDGQYRKGDVGNGEKIPYIAHPLEVARRLASYGFDTEVIAAGFLHDVVEDTDYTLEDIEYLFGKKIASLVEGDSEEDKSLSWQERKQGTIDRIKDLDLEHKAIVCCDKCSNLDSIYLLSGKKGYLNFKDFKGEVVEYEWYYNSIYESLIYNQDKNHPMFRELKSLINLVFDTDNAFSKDYISILKYKRQELLKLKQLFDINSLNIDKEIRKHIDKNTYPHVKHLLDSFGITMFFHNTSNAEYNYNTNDVIDDLINELYHKMLIEIDKKIQVKKRMKIN